MVRWGIIERRRAKREGKNWKQVSDAMLRVICFQLCHGKTNVEMDFLIWVNIVIDFRFLDNKNI
jgi:hypothetical protein